MKKLQEMQAEYTKVICVVCEKACQAYYGNWGNVGTCSRKCERAQEALPTREKYNHPNPTR